jgi:hypothetical protein
MTDIQLGRLLAVEAVRRLEANKGPSWWATTGFIHALPKDVVVTSAKSRGEGGADVRLTIAQRTSVRILVTESEVVLSDDPRGRFPLSEALKPEFWALPEVVAVLYDRIKVKR